MTPLDLRWVFFGVRVVQPTTTVFCKNSFCCSNSTLLVGDPLQSPNFRHCWINIQPSVMYESDMRIYFALEKYIMVWFKLSDLGSYSRLAAVESPIDENDDLACKIGFRPKRFWSSTRFFLALGRWTLVFLTKIIYDHLRGNMRMNGRMERGIPFSEKRTKPGDDGAMHGHCMPQWDMVLAGTSLATRYVLCPCFLAQSCCRLRAMAGMVGGFKLVDVAYFHHFPSVRVKVFPNLWL